MRNMPTFKTLALIPLTLTALIGCDSKSTGTPPAHDQPPVDPLPAVIHGHRLPPEPDPRVNNATLLGVDVNHNGVRDDVERWIYATYKDKHPIYIDIAMQAARGYRLVLKKHPKTKNEAMSIMKEVDSSTYCELYYRLNAKYFHDPLLIQDNIDTRFFRHKIYFNTKERLEIYIRYDALFSGGSYTLIPIKERKAACDFNTSKYDKQ